MIVSFRKIGVFNSDSVAVGAFTGSIASEPGFA